MIAGWIHSANLFAENCVPDLVPKKLQAALVSYTPEGGMNFADFARKYSGLVEKAATGGAKLVVFPELVVQDLVDHTRGEDSFGPQVRQLGAFWPEFLQLAREQAHKWNVILYSGTFSRRDGDQVFNTGALIFPDGKTYTQDKLFLTPFEKKWGLSAGRALTVIPTPWGNWVNLICYDCEIPKLSNQLSAIRPTLILVPSMTEAVSGFQRVRWTAQARAIEHKAFVVHVGMVGGPAAWPNYGQGCVIAPHDEIMSGMVSEGGLNRPGVTASTLDFAQLEKSRASDGVYPGRDQEGR